MSTSGRVATVMDSSQNIPDGASISGTSKPLPNATDSGDTGTSDSDSDNNQPHSGSNRTFDMVKGILAPKIAQLLANRRASGGESSRSYYRPLDILDTQVVFDGV